MSATTQAPASTRDDAPAETRPRRRRTWRTALVVCSLIAFVHGAVWAVFSPPFQPPDEAAHVSYAFTIAATGKLPGDSDEQRQNANTQVAPDVDAVLHQMPWASEGPPSWSPAQAAILKRSVQNVPTRPGGPTYVGVTPPLYYALEAIPAKVFSGSDIFDRLLIMRLLSSLFAAGTVALVFLFMRELLPTRPWAWVAGGLVVALQPVFGHLAGAVSVDNLLFLTGALLFYLTARAFRRGLTPKLGLAIGAAAVAGALTKATIFGLFPGIAVGLLLLAWRTPPEQRRRAFISLGIAAVVFALPYAGWLWANTAVFHRDASTTTGGFASSDVTRNITFRGQLSYTWQFFLPRMWFMQVDFFPSFPNYGLWQAYVEGFVGRFGFFQYSFPTWATIAGGSIFSVIFLGALAALVRVKGLLRRRGIEFVTYALMFAGLLAVVSVVGYRYKALTQTSFEQTRYLLPALALWGALVAVGSIGLSTRRFPAPAIATLIVTLVAGQAFFSILLTVGRFWGYLYQ